MKRELKASLRWLALGTLLLGGSCAQLSSNALRSTERLPQASDPLAGGREVAVAMLRTTAVATLRQPVTTAKLGFALLWHRPREIISGNLPVDLDLEPLPVETPGSPGVERLLDQRRFPRAENGTLSWLVDGARFFPELDRQIAAAKKSIDLQVYIFDNDDIAVRYADSLKRRAARIPVRVLFDDVGSTFAALAAPETFGPPGFVPPADIEQYLKTDSRVGVRRILDPWLVADHTKLFVFDGRSALLGGMNLGREYFSEWHDLMARVDGPIVTSLSREFKRAWRKAGPAGDFALLRKPSVLRRPAPISKGIPLRILRTDPAEGRYEFLDATLLACRAARHRIWIESPYFASDELARAVEAAARRGVDVRVILPKRGDSGIMDVGNIATAWGLLQAGAKVFRYPGMTHTKVMLCDGWGCFGSANLDILSTRINRELNLAFSDPATIRALERQVFLPDMRRSGAFRPEDAASLVVPLAETIADQF